MYREWWKLLLVGGLDVKDSSKKIVVVLLPR